MQVPRKRGSPKLEEPVLSLDGMSLTFGVLAQDTSHQLLGGLPLWFPVMLLQVSFGRPRCRAYAYCDFVASCHQHYSLVFRDAGACPSEVLVAVLLLQEDLFNEISNIAQLSARTDHM